KNCLHPGVGNTFEPDWGLLLTPLGEYFWTYFVFNGEYFWTLTLEILKNQFPYIKLTPGEEALKTFNICPSDKISVITGAEETPVFSYKKWGFTTKVGNKSFFQFNSRIETIRKSAYWLNLFDKSRCLVPMSGFIEWKDKTPYLFTLKTKNLFYVPGILKTEKGEDFVSLITCEANELVREYHSKNRMAVILTANDKYLSNSLEENLNKCVPYPAEQMEVSKVEGI
ncbi:MAG: SOS response-associated peptidase, partial [Ignavibacteria bacterium]|nr:SOS response-associated peptidase [Ignavibacteria bacterium]